MNTYKNLQFSFIFLISLLATAQSWAAACCGGGSAIPSILTSDDQRQISGSYSYSQVDTDVFTNGVWQKRSVDDVTKIYKLEAAQIFADRYQTGFSIPIQTREKSGQEGGTSSGLGDISLQIGYEYLPDWDYNPYRPKGIGFLTLTTPTGKSIDASSDGRGLDSSGRGFWSLGLGTVLTKSWVFGQQAIDCNSIFEIHRSFSRHAQQSEMSGELNPGYGGSFLFGSGYSFSNWRIGASVSWMHEDPIQFKPDSVIVASSPGATQRNATGTLSTSYLFADLWSGTISYSDQTVFGDPTNSTLNKSFALVLQKRWAR